MTAFDFAIEARGDEAVLNSEALAHSSKGVDLYRAIERGFWAGGIPMGEDSVIVGLDHADGKGESGHIG